MFLPSLPAFKSRYLVSFSSNSTFLFFLFRKLARNENKRKLFLTYVTLNGTHYTYDGKPQISIKMRFIVNSNARKLNDKNHAKNVKRDI